MIKHLIYSIFVVLLVLAEDGSSRSVSIGNLQNIVVCENSGGQSLAIYYRESFKPNVYYKPDIYCQCEIDKFMKTSELKDWKGCNYQNTFMTEREFINEINNLDHVASISGNIDAKYKDIIKDKIFSRNVRQAIYVAISICLVLSIYLFFKNRKFKKNTKK